MKKANSPQQKKLTLGTLTVTLSLLVNDQTGPRDTNSYFYIPLSEYQVAEVFNVREPKLSLQ